MSQRAWLVEAMLGLALLGLAMVGLGCGAPPAPPKQLTIDTEPGLPAMTARPLSSSEPVPKVVDVVRQRLAFGAGEICLIDDGALYCWKPSSDVVTAPLRTTLKPKLADQRVTSIAGGRRHSCATTAAGTVWCWGDNERGQLGAGSALEKSATPLQVADIDDAVSVFVGVFHSCVIRRGGGVACWGNNDRGQAGHTTAYTSQARRLVRPMHVAGVEQALQVAIGHSEVCAATRSGATMCWGAYRILQQRAAEPLSQPKPLTELEGALSISVDDGAGCVVRAERDVLCWGWNYAGRLGIAGEDAGPPVENLHKVKSVHLAISHTCALKNDGGVACWGYHSNGELGRPDDQLAGKDGDYRALPVVGLSNVVEVAVGSESSCAITRDHKLYCWGGTPFTPDGDDVRLPEVRAIR